MNTYLAFFSPPLILLFSLPKPAAPKDEVLSVHASSIG